MARLKIDYGIDLGTTNSAICRMEKGKPIIIKSDIGADIMPSCVSFNKRKSVRVGQGAYNNMNQDKRRATKSWYVEASNTYIEFKRTMATDTKYYSSFMERDFTSEELSAEVLKTLKSYVTDENISSVVITVPAKFTVNQTTATMEAAKMAGFKRCELLQEPIAAAMAYGLSTDTKNGIWMVFDFGGGTFDAALLKVEDGIMQVFDTEGDNYLGGKNLDYAIVDKIIVPYLLENYAIDGYLRDKQKKEVLRDAMKTYAEGVKIQLSFKDHEDIISNLGELGEDENGEEIELDITVNQADAFNVMRPYFQKAVDICKNLLERNHLKSSQLDKLILVGGPTHSPLIRQMLKEQLTPNVDTSIDPMTAVATGAALYASTLDAEVSDDDLTVETVKLEVGYEATSVETTEWVSVKLPADAKQDKVFVELVYSDKSWSSGKVEIDKNGNVIEANLNEGRPNSFSVLCYDAYGNLLPCFPDEITIIQGAKVGAAPLPYNIGIAVWDSNKERAVFRMARGLEKNKPVPATGVVNDLKTTSQLRPGVEDDVTTIPIYQVDDFSEAENRPVSLYEHIGDVVINGDEVEQFIPTESLVNITLKVDSSEQMKIEAYFPATDTTIEKPLDTSKKQSLEEAERYIVKGLSDAQRSINRLRVSGISIDDVERELEQVKYEAQNSSEKKMVLQHLKEVLRKIEDLDESTEWQRLEDDLRYEFEQLEEAQEKHGDVKSQQAVDNLRLQVDKAISAKDVKIGYEVLEQMRSLHAHLCMLELCIELIYDYNRRFTSVCWKDSSRARHLINKGMEEINNQPTVEDLHPIACSIIELLPDDEAKNAGGLLT